MEISEDLKEILLQMQLREITERQIYINVSKITKDDNNKKILLKIAGDEEEHYKFIKTYTGTEISPDKKRIWFYSVIARLFGFTFAVKQMEGRENEAVKGYSYGKLSKSLPEFSKISEDEEKHEFLLLDMLDEEKLKYIGSIVLGLNDALVEITGSVAGFTLSMANTKIIALSGIITGISATLSMAASEYIAEKAENTKNALKSSTYTGVSYLITVILLIIPFLLMPGDMYIQALVVTLAIAVIIISIFNYYISVAKGFNFKQRFIQMAGVSLGVALFSFLVGLIVKNILGINL
ncbi:VIT1/CCC1 transporter family protein [Clostridium luticellarii]|jgi:VIT1/CCC1 family predicted Fe2+/Mn2+ transporter|uniref:VIT family protein n=1 Tax=Clostridium luticellarii TaxID=1691940 RepID=A0A2T0BGQ9_9CLOT|nr:VIT1/CCC1 transporter family protein [Clostridium luticellarii]MCI1943948.1 VIT1/CCC1 transporter family protein [Clostridium luticellarii]MCI1967209.1 VIT1/CCC1 transporter family protein [Clostridium luticellarii]MCI1995940.1 VIT1/CCC1 transporter family protein [Clostridium luticellarii]MCI2038471.1 VIT1/CCC1 transporter family protein [Clostridium luticellarii]PRR83090.1 VIT family protein [Clostridium luticellarii]